MQSSKMLALVGVCVLMVAAVATAGDKMVIANYQRINFTGNVRIGGVLLPQGDYEVRHQMDGQNHLMIFRKLGNGKPVQVQVKCSLVPLAEKANRTEKVFVLNAANEQVLQEIVFRGDSAKHVF